MLPEQGWYAEVFGAREENRLAVPDGRLMQAALRFGDSAVMLADEFPEMDVLSPLSIGGTATVLHFACNDANAVWQRALAGGAIVRQPLQEAFWVSCTGRSPIRSATAGESGFSEVPREELERAVADAFRQLSPQGRERVCAATTEIVFIPD